MLSFRRTSSLIPLKRRLPHQPGPGVRPGPGKAGGERWGVSGAREDGSGIFHCG